MKNQNFLILFRQGGKGASCKFVPDVQYIPTGSEHAAVAWVLVYRTDIIHLVQRQGAELGFPFSLTGHIPQMGPGSIAKDGFAESVKAAAFSIITGDVIHLLTPDLRENEKPGAYALSAVLLGQFRPAPKNRKKRQHSPGKYAVFRANVKVL